MAGDARRRLTIGFPRMHKEPGERRDFLPPLVGLLDGAAAPRSSSSPGIGSGMGYSDVDYTALSPDVHVTDEETTYRQDVVVVLRAPDGQVREAPARRRSSSRCSTSRPGRRGSGCCGTSASRRSPST